MKISKILLIGIILAILVALAFISFMSAYPRLPAKILHQRLLIATPLGATMDDVRKYISAKGWSISDSDEHEGFLYQGGDERKKIGKKFMAAYLGNYTGLPFKVDVVVYWGFDEQSRLIDIWVWKTIDAL